MEEKNYGDYSGIDYSVTEYTEVCEDIEQDVLPPCPDFSGSRIGKLKRFLYGRKYLGFCFLAPFVLMLLIYVAMGVWPVSTGSVLVLDLNAQYVYYLEKLRDIFLGEGSLLYTFERALGGEFMGIFAYYLASPLNLLTVLFPKGAITESLLFLLTLRCGLSGLTFGIFLHETRGKRRPAATVLFSVMYALSAFAVVMQHNFMWTDNIICLPLIMLGIERLIKHGRFKTYVVFLAIAVFSNFYIGYMTCLFVAFYFFIRYFSMTPEERNPMGVRFHLPKALGRIILFSLIAVMIAAVVILTAYYSLSFGKLEFSDPDYTPKQLFNFTELLSKFYFGSYDTVRPEGAPFLYAGMLMTLLMPLYFITPGISARRKVGAGALMALFIVSFNLSTADLIWHGFQRPNWLNARFAFMFVMIALVMAYEVFVRIGSLGYRKVIASGAVSVLILVVLQATGVDNLPTFRGIWASIGIIGLYLAVLRFTYKGAAKQSLRLSAVALVLVVCTEMFAASVVNLYALDSDVIFSSRTSYREYIDPYLEATELVEDDGFYRSEKLHHRKTNDNLAIGLNGLSNSTSTLNAAAIDFMSSMGLTSKSHWSKYVGGTVTSDIFFGIKYLYIDTDKKTVPDYVEKYYELIGETDDNILVYKNPYALPIAFSAGKGEDQSVLSGESYDNPFELMNGILAATTGNEDAGVWEKVTINDMDYSGCRKFGVQDNHTGFEKNSETSSTVTYTITAPNEDNIYMYITSKWPRKAKLKVNGKTVGDYFTNDTHGIVDLGSFEAGEEIMVVFTLSEQKTYMQNGDDYFFSFNEDKFDGIKASLAECAMNVTSHGEDRLSGDITVPEGGRIILTTIPYDEGWHIRCDGEEIEYSKSFDSLISFMLPEGRYEIEMRYMPKCFVRGMAISIAGLVLFAVCCVLSCILKKQREKNKRLMTVVDVFNATAENASAELISGEEKPSLGFMDKIAEMAGIDRENSSISDAVEEEDSKTEENEGEDR